MAPGQEQQDIELPDSSGRTHNPDGHHGGKDDWISRVKEHKWTTLGLLSLGLLFLAVFVAGACTKGLKRRPNDIDNIVLFTLITVTLSQFFQATISLLLLYGLKVKSAGLPVFVAWIMVVVTTVLAILFGRWKADMAD